MKIRNLLLWITLILIQHISFCQEIDWIFKPIITEADEIITHPTDNPLIKTKSNGKYGIKDLNNNTLIQPIHESLYISLDQKYIYLKPRKSRSFRFVLNKFGDTLDIDRKVAIKHPYKLHFIRNSKYGNHHEIEVNKFAKRHSLKAIFLEDQWHLGSFNIVDKNGHAIIDSLTFSNSTFYFEEGYLEYSMNGEMHVFDKNGQVVFKYDSGKKLLSNKKGLFLFRGTFMDQDFKKIASSTDENIRLVEGHELYISSTKQDGQSISYLKNLEGEDILGDSYKSINQFDINWLILNDENHSQLYSLIEQKIVMKSKPGEHFFDNLSKAIPDELIMTKLIDTEENNYGLINYLNKKQLLENEFSQIISKKQSIIAYKKIPGTKLKDFMVLNKQGDLLFQVKAIMVNELNEHTYFIRGSDNYNKLVDSNGNKLFEVENHYILGNTDPYWLYKVDVRKKKKYYLVSDLALGMFKEYDTVEKPKIHHDINYPPHYIVSSNGKYGMLSVEKGVIVDLTYDKLVFGKDESQNPTHNNVILAKSNGKWGAFWNPIMK